MHDLETIRKNLHAIGQSHVLRWYDSLDPTAQECLLEQLASLDYDALPGLIESYVKSKPSLSLPESIEPAPYYPNDHTAAFRPWDKAAMRAQGESLLRNGKVACFTVAGGQGTRLGYDGPKGCYPAGAVSGRSLFAFFARAIAKTRAKYGAALPWYIMTSPLNHDATVEYFEQHHFFDLPAEDVMFFPQGVMPSFDMHTGRILLADRGRIATNPDGHGGSLRALGASGALEDMKRRGVEQISYFQVDNPIVRVADPVFLGLHVAAEDSSGEMSSKMLAKAYPEEKLGMFCMADGKLTIIEYSDLPMERQRERLDDGRLRFLAGSPAIHLLSVAFVEKLNADPAFSLPWHRAEKKVACVDPETGEAIKPESPNAVKLERFVFDAIPLAAKSIVYEADRVEEFAPIKNASGNDSAQSSKAIQTLRAARWLDRAGVSIPWSDHASEYCNWCKHPDCVIELDPMSAVEPEDLQAIPLPDVIEAGASVLV